MSLLLVLLLTATMITTSFLPGLFGIALITMVACAYLAKAAG